MRKALKFFIHVTLFGDIFHNFGAVNKIQLSQDILDLTICNLKLSEAQVAIGFSTTDNILKVELRTLLFE